MDEPAILTPDQRVRVFVSSTLNELAAERRSVRGAIEQLHLAPVMFEAGARPYPPRNLYLAYLRQSHVFIGIYGDQYGWVAPEMDVSGLEDELRNASSMPMLIYVRSPARSRDPRLTEMISRLQELGEVSYKHFSTAEELASLVCDDLAVMMTETFTTSRRAAVAVHLPRPASEFVGRWTELAELVELVTSEGVRLVTLTGPGGIGKTRLAIEVARAAIDHFPDGVTFVPLAARQPDDFQEAVAAAVGLKDLGQEPLPQLLARYLRDRRQLLVLDNFEQLAPAAAEIAALLEQTTGIRLLVTSRTALRLSGEEEFPVPPLTLPRVTSRPDDVARAEAAQLFCRRVAAVRHGYTITVQDAATVARICQRLDGLPLALELVAARATVMSVDELAAGLDAVLDLSTRSPDVPARQRTLRQTMDWSYDQLPAVAAAAFARLGVFAGTFSAEAAAAVVPGEEHVDVHDVLAVLVDHSLLRPQVVDGLTRFSMLQIVREYARSRLDAEERESAGQAHASYFRDEAVAAAPGLRGPGQRNTVRRLDLDADDIAAALDWLLDHGQRVEVADMCWSLWLFYWLRNAMTEGRRWTRAALDADGELPPLQRGRLLAADGFLAAWRRDYELAYTEVTEALEIAGRTGDDELRLLANIMLIIVVGGLGDADRACELAAEAVRIARDRADRWAEAIALTGVCWLYAAHEQFDTEAAAFDEMLAAATEIDDPLVLAMALDNIAELRLWQNRLSEAAELVIGSLQTLSELHMAYAGVGTLITAAALLAHAQHWADALRVQIAADTVMSDINAGLWPPWIPRRDQLLRDAQTHLDDAVYADAVTTSATWAFEQATTEAITALTQLTADAIPIPSRPADDEATATSPPALA